MNWDHVFRSRQWTSIILLAQLSLKSQVQVTMEPPTKRPCVDLNAHHLVIDLHMFQSFLFLGQNILPCPDVDIGSGCYNGPRFAIAEERTRNSSRRCLCLNTSFHQDIFFCVFESIPNLRNCFNGGFYDVDLCLVQRARRESN